MKVRSAIDGAIITIGTERYDTALVPLTCTERLRVERIRDMLVRATERVAVWSNLRDGKLPGGSGPKKVKELNVQDQTVAKLVAKALAKSRGVRGIDKPGTAAIHAEAAQLVSAMDKDARKAARAMVWNAATGDLDEAALLKLAGVAAVAEAAD